MSRVVVTANGNSIDMESLKLKNEKTVAVGNMRVNARGDEISPTTGEIVKTREKRMSEYYKIHSTVPTKKSRKKSQKASEVEVTPVIEPSKVVESVKSVEPQEEEDANS